MRMWLIVALAPTLLAAAPAVASACGDEVEVFVPTRETPSVLLARARQFEAQAIDAEDEAAQAEQDAAGEGLERSSGAPENHRRGA